MRRKEKEITGRAEIEAIIKKALVCRLAMVDENEPYIVPLCFGFRENTIYFHSAIHGKKLDILRKNSRICFEFDADCEICSSEKACDFSMRYSSVIGFGKATFVEQPEAKRDALDVIMAHYADNKFTYTDPVIEKIAVIKVDIDSMTGKASR
jgi:nitroimidazol reductase NimA-like FMN-containing flavoprotein (pyridoxamine 5'-phosphate oxidase superfamily)